MGWQFINGTDKCSVIIYNFIYFFNQQTGEFQVQMEKDAIQYSVYDMHWELIEKYDIYNIKLIERKIVTVTKDPVDPSGKTDITTE